MEAEPIGPTRTRGRAAGPILALLLAVAIAVALGWVVLGPFAGGAAGDAIAGRLDEVCGGSTAREERDAATVYGTEVRAAARYADEVLFITCDSGFVNPGSYLLTFGDAGRLTEALARVEAKPRRGRLCVLDAQMFTPALGADHMFAEVCRQLGGNVLAGSARGGAPAEARAG